MSRFLNFLRGWFGRKPRPLNFADIFEMVGERRSIALSEMARMSDYELDRLPTIPWKYQSTAWSYTPSEAGE